MTFQQPEDEPYAGPFAVPEGLDDKRGVTRAAAARALAEPGFDLKKSSEFWRNAASRGLLHPYRRQVSSPRPHFLYFPEQVLIAAVLIRMSEAGFSGEALMQRAAMALNTFLANDLLTPKEIEAGVAPEPPVRNPASWVFMSYLAGVRGFTYEFGTFRRENTNGLEHRGRVRNYEHGNGTNFHLPADWYQRSVWALDLDPILAHISREKGVLH